MLNCVRSGCGQVRGNHSGTAPHGISGGVCLGYVPIHPCDRCASDCELHEVASPHVRIVNEVVICEGVKTPQGYSEAESPYEGGGGQSGGGGSSGGW